MSLRTEGLLLHTFCGIRESFQVISGHFRSFQVISGHCARSGLRSGQGVVAACRTEARSCAPYKQRTCFVESNSL